MLINERGEIIVRANRVHHYLCHKIGQYIDEYLKRREESKNLESASSCCVLLGGAVHGHYLMSNAYLGDWLVPEDVSEWLSDNWGENAEGTTRVKALGKQLIKLAAESGMDQAQKTQLIILGFL